MNPLLVALFCFTVVMTGMTFLTLLFFALRGLASGRAHAAGAMGAGGAQQVPALGPELVAVLTAAASTALEAPVVLHQVHVYHGPAAERWSRAGRMDIMISHRVEPKR